MPHSGAPVVQLAYQAQVQLRRLALTLLAGPERPVGRLQFLQDGRRGALRPRLDEGTLELDG